MRSRSKITVNVLLKFDGFSGTLLETVERKYTLRGGWSGRAGHRYHTEKRMVVSYVGNRYTVFALPSCYGKIAGNCIDIGRKA